MGASLDIAHFVGKWAGEISVTNRWEPLQPHNKAVLEYHGALLFFLREGTVPRQQINWRQYKPNMILGTSSDAKKQN